MYGVPVTDLSAGAGVPWGLRRRPRRVHAATSSTHAGNGLRQIFLCCEGFSESTDLVRWMDEHEHPPAAFYVNWRGRTMRQVREESALATAVASYLRANQEVPRRSASRHPRHAAPPRRCGSRGRPPDAHGRGANAVEVVDRARRAPGGVAAHCAGAAALYCCCTCRSLRISSGGGKRAIRK